VLSLSSGLGIDGGGGLVTADRRCRILLGLVFACGGGGCTGVVVFDSYYYCS